MTAQEIINSLRELADSMEREKPDWPLRDRLIPALLNWSLGTDDAHGSANVLHRLAKLLEETE